VRLKLKTYGQNFVMPTSDLIFDKATKNVTYIESRPNTTSVGFSVLADNTHGDHKTVNLHEFKKNYLQSYIGTKYTENASQTITRTGNVANFTDFVNAGSLVDSTSLYNSALSNLLDQLRSGGVGSGLDLAIDVAEAGQVKKMLGDVGHLSQYIRGIGLGRWSKKWLEYQYGWRPLVNSIFGSFDALMHRRLYSLQRVVGKSRRFVYDEKNFSDTFSPGSRQRVATVGRYRYKIVAEYDISNTWRQQLSGYTSLNPVGIAWELLPYSFVVDWFYDIGGYLRNMEGALLFGTGFKTGYSVYGYKVDQQGILTGSGTSIGTTIIWNADALSRQTYKIRTPIGVFPFPRIPRFQSDLGWQRLISGASLLANFLHLPGGPRLPGKMPGLPWISDP